MSEVRGSSQKYQSVMAQERLGGATPTPKQEARGGGREELPHTPKPKARGGSQENQPHTQGAMAARAQEGLEEISHLEGQEGQR